MKSKQRKSRIYLAKEATPSLPDESGVYLLYQENGAMVYIGIALSLRKRIPQHVGQKEFCRIGYELVHYSRARKLEEKLLRGYFYEHGQLPYFNRRS
jgi:hypothetical protein